MAKLKSRRGAVPVSGIALTRRTFVAAGAATLSVGAELTAQPFAVVPAAFVKSGGKIDLRRGESVLWSVDERWFDLTQNGRFSVEASGRRMILNGFLAGTNIAVQLKINLIGETMSFESFGGTTQTASIADWTQNRTGVGVQFRLRSYADAAIRLKRSGSAFTATLTPLFDFAAQAAFDYSGDACGSGRTAGLAFEAMPDNADLDIEVDQLLKDARPLSRLTLDRVELSDPGSGWSLGSVGGRKLRLIFAPGSGRIVLDHVAANRQRLVLRRRGTSTGSNGARMRYGDPSYGRDIHVDAIELVQVLDGSGKEQGLKIEGSARPAYIEADRFAAAVKILEDRYFAGFDGQPQIELPVEVFVVHARGGDSTRFEIDYRAIRWDEAGPQIGEPGLDRSSPVWNTEGTSGVRAALTIGSRNGAPREDRIHLGQDDSVRLWLHRPGAAGIRVDSPILRLRRSADALDVGFMFYNFRLEIEEAAQLVAVPGAQRGVRFNPQHLEEECFSAPKETSVWARFASLFSTTALTPFSRRPFRSTDDSVHFPGGSPTLIARTQVAGASRIVFESEAPGTHALTADALTNWKELTLAVPSRAIGELPAEQQLAQVNITKKTTRAQARDLVAATLVQPSSDETALELVTGLFYAPERTARFRTTTPAAVRTALWTAELDTSPRSDVLAAGNPPDPANPPKSAVVRAVWASGLEPSLLFHGACAAPSVDPFPASTSRQDRLEIAIQSSVFGLAGLRAVTLQGVDVPNSRVRRVAPDWSYIDQEGIPAPGGPADGPKIVQEGVFSPAPFREFKARLTGFGTDLDAEWQAEPVAPYNRTGKPPDPFFKRAFSVERYVHRTRLGSDVLAQVVYKGFLFPYGFRVSLIKVTQREPITLPEFGAMMPLITRFYLIPKPVAKTYPGIYQPFEGREIPLASARLLGERTPELDGDAMSPPPGMNLPPLNVGPGGNDCPRPADGEEPPRVFWPVLKSGGRLKFDFTADDLPSRRTLPMLFVSNADANQPGSVREIIRYYNALAAEDRREDHHRAVTVFAPPRKPGNGDQVEASNEIGSTSFETDHILLGARPRVLPEAPGGPPADPDAPYTFDAFMNGADEPPFYPVMIEASITVPPLDRMMGSPQGLKRVGYDSKYVRSGFDRAQNRAELYLNFLDKGVMDLGGNGKISGGVARTPTHIAGVSRINAIVGARPSGSAKLLAAPIGEPPIGSDDRAPWDFDAIRKDEFRPADFFGDAKLLGVVDLASVVELAEIEAQPRLKEVYEYALGDSGAVEVMRAAAARVAALIDAALLEADKNLKRVFAHAGGGPAPGEISVERFYPQLHAQLTGFAAKLRSAPTGPDFLKWGSEVVAQWRQVKSSVDAVIANPSPEPLRAGMAELRAFVDALQSGFGKALRDRLKAALKTLFDGAVDRLADIVAAACFDASGKLTAPWFFEAVTGVPPSSTETQAALRSKVRAIFRSPDAIPPEAARAALAQTLTVPLVTALASAQRLADTVTSLEGAALSAAARAAASLLNDVARAMSTVDVMIAAARQNASALCGAAGAAFRLDELCRLALQIVPPAAAIDAAFKVIQQAWIPLELPGMPDSAAVAAARQASGRLRLAVSGLKDKLSALEAVRDAISALKPDDLCLNRPQQIATLIARLTAARDAVLPALASTVDAARELGTAYAALPQSELTDALAALERVRRQLVVLAADTNWSRLPTLGQLLAWLDSVPVVVTRVAQVKAEVINAAAALRKQADAAVNTTIDELAATVLASQRLARLEQTLLSAAGDFSALTANLIAGIEKVRNDLLTQVAMPLVTLHGEVLKLANQAKAVFDSAPDLVKQFTQKVYKRLIEARDQVQADLAVLNDLTNATGTAAFDQLLERWRTGNFGIAQAVDLILDFFNAIMTGQIGGIFDLAAVRSAAEDAIRQLIPTKVNLSYDWTGNLKKYEIFEPKGDKKLTLSTRISVDLLNPSDRKVSVTGRASEFALNLFGSPELVTINFGETTFSFDGGTPKFATRIISAVPGKDLKFFHQLSQLLGDGDDNRVYVEPLGALEGLKVGYRYSQELIDLGGVQITNFGFDASLGLYFDRRPAIARFAVASREAPCGLIIAPAYYGAGFISLTTTGKSVVAFEIQLEFGAARVLKFGPLRGTASVSAGIYLMRSNTADGSRTRIEGFVHAVGEGHIACFGVSVNFEVKVVHDSGDEKDDEQSKGENKKPAKITGSATYRFSFRIGLVKVGYGVTATYEFEGGARALQPAFAKSLVASPAGSGCPPLPDKTKDWLCYRDNFVAGWPG